MRVGQLALQVESEEGPPKRHARLGVGVAAHVHLLIAELEDELAPLGDGRACEHVLHDGVEGLATLLEEHGDALFHRLGHHAEVASEALLARDEAVGRLAPADPVDALQLRVDDQRVARAAHDDGRVLEREPIGRQTLGHPDSLRGHVGEQLKRVKHLGGRELSAAQVGYPRLLPQLVPELGVERPNVRNEGRGDHHVAHEHRLLLTEELHVGGPAHALVLEAVDETLGEGELLSGGRCLGDQRVLLLSRLHQLVLQRRLARVERVHVLVDCGELLVRFAELVHRLLQQPTLGRHIEVDVVVDEDVDYPVAEAGRRHRDALHVRVVEVGVGRLRSARALGTHLGLVFGQQVVFVKVDE